MLCSEHLDVLDCFLYEPSLSIRELIAHTGLTRSRIMRLAGTLEHRGYLIQDLESKKYLLGTRSAGLGHAFERANNTQTLVRPVLKYLVEQTGESATFYVLDGIERVALVREEGTHAIRLSIFEGHRTPIHAGASGKVLLAFGDSDVLSTIVRKNLLRPITEQTITSVKKLESEIRDIRARGYAISKGENIPGSHAIAAPVFDYKRKLMGAIGIAGPKAGIRLQSERQATSDSVLEAARMLSKRYGCSAAEPEGGGGDAPHPIFRTQRKRIREIAE